MSDDLNKKIKQIADILGQDSMPDNVKGLLSLLGTPSTAREDTSSKPEEVPVQKEENTSRSDMDDGMEMMMRVKKLMDNVNTVNDPRLNLITAIRPFLNSRRQQKLGNCMRLLQMSKVTRMMDNKNT